jgi:hypothetical protein
MSNARTESISILLRVMHENELDPLITFTTVIGMERIVQETFLGETLERLLTVAAGEACVTIEEMIAEFRSLFYGTKKKGKMGVCKVKSSSPSVFQNAKKKLALSMYMASVSKHHPQFPSLMQVIYQGKDLRCGARVHHIHTHAQNFLISARDMLMSPNPPLAVMEVPNVLQGTRKFYVDWDMKLDKLSFLHGTMSQRIDQARKLALQAPSKICQIFIAIGYISSETQVQIVVKEGSRPSVDGTDIAKISFHFITNIFGTSGQIQTISTGFINYIKEHAGTLSGILADTDAPIDRIDLMNGFESLVGVDMHPFSNPEQGLAIGFSRKH